VGCRVETLDGEYVGDVTDVAHLPAQDLLIVQRDGAEILVPFVSEIVPEIDVERRRIIIDPPPGLLADETLPAEDEGA